MFILYKIELKKSKATFTEKNPDHVWKQSETQSMKSIDTFTQKLSQSISVQWDHQLLSKANRKENNT